MCSVRQKPLVAALALLVTLGSLSGCRSEAEKQLRAMADALNRAYQTQDEGLAKVQFTPAAWSRPFGGQNLYEGGLRKGFVLLLKEVTHARERAVIAVDIAREERIVDRVFLYVIRADGQWRIDGLDETKAHPPLFLDGVLPAHFEVYELPGNAVVEKLGNTMLAVVSGNLDARAELVAAGLPAAETGLYLDALSRLKYPSLARTHSSEQLGLAALVFGTAWRDIQSQPLTLYLARAGEGWRIVGSSYVLSNQEFLSGYRR
jgi:hypothetical protein